MLMHQDRELTEPLITPENQAFFNATAQGTLLLRHCQNCGESHFYPRTICPLCGSDQTDWKEASSQGEIYSFSVLRKGVDIPYCIAYVSLPGGVTVLCNIVDCDLDSVRIGQIVKLCFKSTPKGTKLPMFTPA